MPKEDIKREIFLHIPNLDFLRIILDDYMFWGYHTTKTMYSSRVEMQGTNDVWLLHGEIVGLKRKWWQFRSRPYRLAYFTIYTWVDKVAKTEIIAEIRIRALGLPTHFEALKPYLEKYIGRDRVKVSFWDDEPYEVR